MPTPTRPNFIVTVDRATASVAVADADEVRHALHVPVVEWKRTAGTVVGHAAAADFTAVVGDRLEFPAKLVWRLGAVLNRRGVNVELGGHIPVRRPDASGLPPNSIVRKLFEQHPAAHIGGLLETAPGVRVPDAVEDLVAAYPAARVFVGVKNRNEEASYAGLLRRAFPTRPVGTGGEYRGTSIDNEPVVVVGSLHKLDLLTAVQFDVAILPDAGPLRARDPRPVPADWRERRGLGRLYDLLRDVRVPAFGFLPQDVCLTDGERARLRVFFGAEFSTSDIDPVAGASASCGRRDSSGQPTVGAAGAYASSRRARRRPPVGAHAGNRRDFLGRHGAAAARRAASGGQCSDFLAALFPRLLDKRTLWAACEAVRRDAGPAAGPDGVGPRDLDWAATAGLVDVLRGALDDGSYRPGPTRRVVIPKKGGGTRTLEIQNVADKVAARAILSLAQPFADPQFSRNSLGFRPVKGLIDAVAAVGHHAESRGAWVLVACDVEAAFPSVPHGVLMTAVREMFGHTRFADLIEVVVRANGPRGLAQGSPLSPFLLNLLLDRVLDRPWAAANPDTPLLRYADDLLVVCRDEAEAERTLDRIAALLGAVGMRLKAGKTTTTNLSAGMTAEWLGFALTNVGGKLTASITDDGWTALEELVGEAVATGGDPYGTIAAWWGSRAIGVPEEEFAAAYARVRAIADAHGLNDLRPQEKFDATRRQAATRLTRLKAELDITEHLDNTGGRQHPEKNGTRGKHDDREEGKEAERVRQKSGRKGSELGNKDREVPREETKPEHAPGRSAEKGSEGGRRGTGTGNGSGKTYTEDDRGRDGDTASPALRDRTRTGGAGGRPPSGDHDIYSPRPRVRGRAKADPPTGRRKPRPTEPAAPAPPAGGGSGTGPRTPTTPSATAHPPARPPPAG